MAFDYGNTFTKENFELERFEEGREVFLEHPKDQFGTMLAAASETEAVLAMPIASKELVRFGFHNSGPD